MNFQPGDVTSSLMYLMNTRPNMCYVFNHLTQAMVRPTNLFWKATKHLLWYLRDTTLWTMVQKDRWSEVMWLKKCRFGGKFIKSKEYIRWNFQFWVHSCSLVQQEEKIYGAQLGKIKIHGCKSSKMWGDLDEKDTCGTIWLDDGSNNDLIW